MTNASLHERCRLFLDHLHRQNMLRTGSPVEMLKAFVESEIAISGEPLPSDVPTGYRPLPEGIRCRCIKLAVDANGVYYCCNTWSKP